MKRELRRNYYFGKNYKITISESALLSIQEAESFKLQKTTPAEAYEWADSLFRTSIEAISQDPARYRCNTMLADKGLNIRERIDVDSQYRCLYDFNRESGDVEILLFISTKQDLEKMLYRYMIYSE